MVVPAMATSVQQPSAKDFLWLPLSFHCSTLVRKPQEEIISVNDTRGWTPVSGPRDC